VRRAGDIVAAFFDEETAKRAKDYGKLFSSSLWAGVLEKCGLAQGTPHTRIAELEKSVLLVEADHPGWIQLLQTRQKELLNAVRRQFPEITLTGILFRLTRPTTKLSDNSRSN